MVKELEARVQQLTVEAESSNLQWQTLSQEKTELDKCYQAACSESQEMKARNHSLQKEKDRSVQDYEKRTQQLQSKYDSDMSYITQQNALSAAKASDVIEELEQRVSQLKQQLQELEHQRQQQLREQESRFQKDTFHLERLSDKKVHDLQNKLEEEREKGLKKVSKLEGTLKEKEEQLRRVTEMQRLQAQQADAALEAFKRQVETNTEKAYSEMKQQMEKVEVDLSRSKSLREKQSKEFSWQLGDLKQRYENQIVELKLEQEQEKTYLFQQHNTEKDSIVKDREQAIDMLEKELRITVSDHETKSQSLRQQDSQIVSELEVQVHKLKEELIHVNSQRKQQLEELALLRDEEKQKAAREHEVALSKLRAEMETMKVVMQRTHASETEEALEKVRGECLESEKEYGEYDCSFFQMVSELQASITSVRDESGRQQLATERKLQDKAQKCESEKRQLIKDNEKAIKLLNDEVENYCNQLRSTEKKLQQKELDKQEQMTHIRQEYEMRIKGLMPFAMRQELEDTILSLKSQVNFLQKRAQVLQEDLNTNQNKR
ncbi:centrosomal protein of 112 kDa [Ascaphus truei]|uniref:centrosomal protein of 112 kDa n=1 Tax=Ascaphus truei TaxID=8439 RepID=UPI003F592697